MSRMGELSMVIDQLEQKATPMSRMGELSMVIDQLEQKATPDQVEQIRRIIERYESDHVYSVPLAAAHIGAVFGEILEVSTWDEVVAWATTRPRAVAMTDRTDEVGFRTNVPAVLEGITIVQVSHFRPGSKERGEYARALAVGHREDTGLFSTHWVIYQDELNNWFLWQGHYDITTRAAAESDVRARAGEV